VKQPTGEKTKRGRIVIVVVVTNVYLDNGIPYIQLLKIFICTQINSEHCERFAAIIFELISNLSRIKLFGSFAKLFDLTLTLVYKQFYYFVKVACIQYVLMYMAHGHRIQTFQKFKHIGYTPYGRSINKEMFKAKN